MKAVEDPAACAAACRTARGLRGPRRSGNLSWSPEAPAVADSDQRRTLISKAACAAYQWRGSQAGDEVDVWRANARGLLANSSRPFAAV